MISDMLTAVIIVIMAILVIYPATRSLIQAWQNRQRRESQGEEVARRR